MEIPRGFKGVWIPKEIWLSPDLNIKEKILLVEIDSLDRENGCYAKNKHFSDFIGISEHRISRMISKLKANGHIVIDQKNIKGNTIRTMRSAYAKMSMRSVAPMQKSTEGVCENEQASTSNTLSNTEHIAPETGARSDQPIIDTIKAMESVDPKNKTYYGNTTQRSAADFLVKEYGLEEVLHRISFLEKTNNIPYFPTITTPVQLKDKWVQLAGAITRKHEDQKSKRPVII